MSTAYIYLPWVRQGLAGAIADQDLGSVTLKNRVQMRVQAWVNNEPPVSANVKLYGPGDVLGFSHQQIIRPEPKPFTNNFEPNYFPFVEFDRPDFPWLFTPAQANSRGQLRPWLCLIVVEKKEDILKDSRPLPILTIDNQQLPNLAESWAWAYAQVMDTGDLDSALKKYPEQNLSRLICPRALQANTNYYGCLVPAFEAGRLAGLGLAVDDNGNLQPAWDHLASGSTQLPVYYHWEFGTGPAGDFEALVWQLQRRDLSDLADKIGNRPMQVQNVGVLGLEGALRVVEIDSAYEQQVRQALQDFSRDLRDLLNAPETAQIQSWLGSFTIKPPRYGQWLSASEALIKDPAVCPAWYYELNLDPRHRVAAGLATQVVQNLQEALMASAWQQVEGIEKANQLLRQSQLARAGSRSFHQHLSNLAAEDLVSLTGPVHSRVLSSRQTIRRQMDLSPAPLAAVAGAFRKITSPRGVLSRRAAALTGQSLSPGRLLARLNNRQIRVVKPDFTPAGLTASDLNDAYENLRGASPQEQSFIQAARLQQAHLPRHGEPQPPPRPLNLANLRPILVAALDPETTIPAVINERITPPENWKPEDPLEPIMAAPVFPTPMYKPLLELSPDWLLPGLGQVPDNTIAGLMTNPRFIRAYMVGLNHEMARELLWREFPTDQRGTCFRQFWDPAGHVPKPQSDADWEKLKDIRLITDWPKAQGLAANLGNDPMQSQVVLLIRGELLRRYPGALIYAAQAEWNSTPVSPEFWGRKIKTVVTDPQASGYIAPGSPNFPEKYPNFQGRLDPDITFICFDLEVDQARGFEDPNHQQGAGWFFVIQQPPTEPRFGLDAAAPSVAATAWTDLSWENVAKSGAGYIQLSNGLSNFPALNAPSGAAWGANMTSADLASISLQRPVRIAIHASDLLPARGTA